MKVLQIIPSFGIGGAEKVVLNYLRISKKNNLGFIAISLYSSTGSVYDEVIKNEKLDVIYLDKKLGADFGIVSKLKKEIQRINPDIVHTHLYSLKYYLLTFEWKKRRNFHTIHSIPSVDATGVDYYINKFMFSKKNSIPIVLHARLCEEVKKYYSVNVAKCVGNGLFVDEYKNGSIKEVNKKKFGIRDNDFVIGHIGRFDKHKNHLFMIELLKEILNIKYNVKLLLIGNGDQFEYIRELSKKKGVFDNIIFAGNRIDIPDLLKLMDVFLFPSLHEGLGIAVIEAQLAGVRCVVSKCVPEAVRVSDGIDFLDLEESKDVWINKIFAGERVVHLNNSVNKFDIERIIENLMKIYGN